MAIENRRGCGYRKVGGMYLIGGDIASGCDRLPIEIGTCRACGCGIRITRAPLKINAYELWGDHVDCKDGVLCRVCAPNNGISFIMGVGEKYYTPQEFIAEGVTMGVSKRIAQIPKGLVLGFTTIYLTHSKAIYVGQNNGNKVYKPAVFCAFTPKRIEKLLWQKDATDKALAELKKRGITPVIIPDGDKDHA